MEKPKAQEQPQINQNEPVETPVIRITDNQATHRRYFLTNQNQIGESASNFDGIDCQDVNLSVGHSDPPLSNRNNLSQNHSNSQRNNPYITSLQQNLQQQVDETKEYMRQVPQKLQEYTSDAAVKTRQTIQQAGDKFYQATAEAAENTKKTIHDAGQKVAVTAAETADKTKEVVIVAQNKIQVATEVTTYKTREFVADTVNQIKRAFIGARFEAEEYQQDNEFIKQGYRIDHHTCGQATKSLFTCHNETVNVWTHLVGAIVFFCFLIVLAAMIIPSRFEYGREMVDNYSGQQFVLDYIHTKIDNLDESINYSSDHKFEDMFKQAEGITYFSVHKLITFDWIIGQQENDTEQIIKIWAKGISDVCNSLVQIHTDLYELSDKQHLTEQLEFYRQRLSDLQTETQIVQRDLITQYGVQKYPKSELNSRLEQFNFKSPDVILSYVTIAPLLVNLASAVFCLGCSATFHLYAVKSQKINNILSRLDYGGISILIFGSAVPPIIYGFACDGSFVARYTLLGCQLALCAACFIVTLIKKFDSPKYRPVRGFMFIGAGLATIAIFITNNVGDMDFKVKVPSLWYGVGGAVYIAGASTYVARVPERCKPGAFDLCGASHQIFHVAVLIGCGMHFYINHQLYWTRQTFECPMRG